LCVDLANKVFPEVLCLVVPLHEERFVCSWDESYGEHIPSAAYIACIGEYSSLSPERVDGIFQKPPGQRALGCQCGALMGRELPVNTAIDAESPAQIDGRLKGNEMDVSFDAAGRPIEQCDKVTRLIGRGATEAAAKERRRRIVWFGHLQNSEWNALSPKPFAQLVPYCRQ
jgi:hypothetical protein